MSGQNERERHVIENEDLLPVDTSKFSETFYNIEDPMSIIQNRNEKGHRFSSSRKNMTHALSEND
jgi:hypothetical protein